MKLETASELRQTINLSPCRSRSQENFIRFDHFTLYLCINGEHIDRKLDALAKLLLYFLDLLLL